VVERRCLSFRGAAFDAPDVDRANRNLLAGRRDAEKGPAVGSAPGIAGDDLVAAENAVLDRDTNNSIMHISIIEHIAKTQRHKSFYLACGTPQATAIIFLHGWPELSISWRHQLPVFAAVGFRALAPDLRGYGRSSIYGHHSDYALEEIVADMMELLDAIGAEKAIWVGHDWGSPVVWSIAQHHPHRCHGVASLCVP
jgi:hypothetical protein